MPARQVLGLRRQGHLGLGRLQRRVRRRPGSVGAEEKVEEAKEKKKPLQYVPNAGFLLVSGEKGEIYIRLFSYARYLNQKGLDPTYVDSFGNTKTVQQREDFQLNKFFLPFSGWFLTPKMRYYLYVWSSNPSQGDPAQVVGAGNLSYVFNRHVTFGAGISSLPSVRSTEGQFPYWLGVDDRLTADEFFRGSYTTGIWLKGEISTKVKYMAMLANNLSTLGVSASQIDNTIDTTSFMLQWLPTTGEFGLYGTFGDFDHHEKLATRLAAHYTHSTEDKQSQPGTNGIENSQIRLTDGSVIFTPDLFGPGHHGREGDLRHGERGRRGQVPGPLAGGRVLLALAEQLQGHEHRGHRGHRRTRGSRSSPRRWSCRRRCRCT